MGRTHSSRQAPASRPTQADQQQLVAIATVLLAGYATEQATEQAVAEAMVGVLPLVTFLGSVELARLVAREVAELAIDAPGVTVSSGSGGVLEQRTLYDQAIYRAAYLRAGASRLANAIRDEGMSQELLDRWRVAEERYFRLHLDAMTSRAEVYGRVQQAIDIYGEVLGWYAEIRPTSRPNHRAAHRANWRPLLGPPLLTTAYPGVLLHCLCESGPPIPGAREIR